MDNDKAAGEELPAEFAEEDEERELDLGDLETEDLDVAMREALEAVERSADSAEAVDVTAADQLAAGGGGELATLQAELAELRDRSVRTLADFDNYRKRVTRERAAEKRYAPGDLAQDMLSVVDNLERAVEAEGETADLRQGVDMILKQLVAALGRHGVARVAALGEPFDPAVHEAVASVEDAEVGEPTVRAELQSGYTLHDRLLRPAMVKVAVPVVEAEPPPDAAEAPPAEAERPETD